MLSERFRAPDAVAQRLGWVYQEPRDFMASSAIDSSAAKQAITGTHAERILRAARDGRATVTLRAASWGTGKSVRSTVESLEDGAMVVHVSEADASMLRGSIESLDAGFSIDGQAYSFTTSVLRQDDDGDAIRLTCPAELAASQRRRTRRYRLARARAVEVRDPSGGDLLCTATLLNLSPDGIAAKTGDPLTDRCQGGQSCRIRFRLDDDTPEFELAARITNVTPAGDPGQVVLGMEFLRDELFESTRARISASLTTRSPRATEGAP